MAHLLLSAPYNLRDYSEFYSKEMFVFVSALRKLKFNNENKRRRNQFIRSAAHFLCGIFLCFEPRHFFYASHKSFVQSEARAVCVPVQAADSIAVIMKIFIFPPHHNKSAPDLDDDISATPSGCLLSARHVCVRATDV